MWGILADEQRRMQPAARGFELVKWLTGDVTPALVSKQRWCSGTFQDTPRVRSRSGTGHLSIPRDVRFRTVRFHKRKGCDLETAWCVAVNYCNETRV
jgi:hypothetical protein